MTKSVPAPTHLSANLSQPAPQSQPIRRTQGWGHALLTLSLRLMLLGLGGSMMAAVGIAAAQIYPAQTQDLPLVEILAQRAKSMLDRGLNRVGISLQPEVQSPSVLPDLPPDLSAVAPLQVSPVAASPGATVLSDAERQNLQAELTQLQAELQALTSQSNQTLAARVQPLQTRIQTIQSRLSAFTMDSPVVAGSTHSLTSPTTNSSTSSTSSVSPAAAPAASQSLLVTFPSDVLFDAGQVTLRSGSDAILSSIVTDLQSFPTASIQVSAYTDGQSSPELARERSLEQAKAVRQYLSQQLGTEVHWVAIGQGQNQPLLPEDSAESRQRNRRIEIAIQPE